MSFGIDLGCLRGETEQTDPEIDAHGGDEAAGQKGCVFETDQQAGLPHARVPDQHHLCGGEGGKVSPPPNHREKELLKESIDPMGGCSASHQGRRRQKVWMVFWMLRHSSSHGVCVRSWATVVET